MVKRIAITGVESTGKSILSKELAKHFNGALVEEYARTFFNNHTLDYKITDIDTIALEQFKQIQTTVANPLKFIDTEMYMCKIWSEVKFNRCNLQILNACLAQNVDAYIIPDIDLPWQYDPLRECPSLEERTMLMQYYVEHIEQTGKPFIVVSGTGHARWQAAIDFVNSLQ
jgi:nicotinamide riboside kinase